MSDEDSKRLTLLREEVPTAFLGTVVVRGLKLSERLALNRANESDRGNSGATDMFCARLLHATCSTVDGQAIYDLEQWDIFAGREQADTNLLFDVAMRLGGFERAAPKND